MVPLSYSDQNPRITEFMKANSRRPVVFNQDPQPVNSDDGAQRIAKGGGASTKGSYSSLAHKILKIEFDELGIAPNAQSIVTENLNSFLDKAKANIQEARLGKNKLTFDEQKQVIQILDATLKQQGFQMITSVDSSQRLFTLALGNKKYQCTNGSMMMLCANEALKLKLPLKMVDIRDHTFLRLGEASDEHINWDVQLKEFRDDQTYLNEFQLKGIPNGSNYMKALSDSEIIAHARNDIGLFMEAKDAFRPRALSQFQEALSANPNSHEAYSNLSRSYLRAGLPAPGFSGDRGLLSQALEASNIGLEIFPDSAELHVSQGRAYDALGQVDKALSSMTKAIELYPALHTAHFFKAIAEFKLRRPQDAIQTMNSLVDRNPTNPRVYLMRAEFYNMIGNQQASEKDKITASQLGQA